MTFLGQLASQINNQFTIGENSNNSLDAVVNGQNVKYGSLGDFANKIDQSARRSYFEEGYLRTDPYTISPKQLEVLFQEPTGTVLVKKKELNSLAENQNTIFMDSDEKLYLKTMKVLFQNKCNQIAVLEKLSKIQQVTSAVGSIDAQLMPIIFTLSDSLSDGLDSGSNLFGALGNSSPFAQSQDASSFTKAIDRVRKLYAFNQTNPTTTWITDPTNLFNSQFGQGTGVIEITQFTGLNTTTTVDMSSPGNFNLNIADPYQAMLITEFDIEKSISDATNSFYNHKSYQFGQQASDQVINDAQAQLNQLRQIRSASPITFNLAPNTLLGKRVTAIIQRSGTELLFTYNSSGNIGGISFPGLGGAGNSVSVSPDYLKGGIIAGLDGLDPTSPNGGDSELTVFQRLIAAIFNQMQLQANSQNSLKSINTFTNYVRRKLRFNYLGKQIVSPMDSIHIYLSSKSRYDSKLMTGITDLFGGVGILQNLNNSIVNLQNATDILFNPSNVNITAEKSIYVGANFPSYLWALMRSQFVTEKEGTHVFAGLVDRAVSSWSDGKFTVAVSGRDNSAYFEMGKVNFKPSVDAFNGVIYDPLTPFKTTFDTINSNTKDNTPELLDENKYLLGSGQQRSLVKAKLGPNAGQPITLDNFIQDRSIDPLSGRLTRVFYAPDGLVYKWKEGVGSFVQYGSSVDFNSIDKVGTPNIYKDPFAGQDTMNIISLLITGRPYNFATYWKTTSNLFGFGQDPQSSQDASYSFATALSKDLSKNNSLWGNFIPFKSLVVDEQSYSKALQSQFRINQQNQQLATQLQKLQQLNQQANLFGANSVFTPDKSSQFSSDLLALQAQATVIDAQVQQIMQQLRNSDQSFLSTVGEDTSLDYTNFLDSNKITKRDNSDQTRSLLRRQINYLTRRMSYSVRGNEDKNLFIVDDSYDKDYDIAAYNSDLTDGLSLFNNDFNSVKEKILTTANVLNLEVFCDTQGHIRVRPPQYNRMPSSVFYRMMFLKQNLGVQVFPQFLEDLFSTQLDTLRQQIEIIEDYIRLDCAVLGFNDDDSATKFILFNGDNSPTSGTGSTFNFISNSNDYITDINSLVQAANPDLQNQQTDQSLQTFASIQGQATSTKDLFTNTQRYSDVVATLKGQATQASGISVLNLDQFNSNPLIDTLMKRIQLKSGQSVPKDNFITNNPDTNALGVELPAGTTLDIFKITKDLSTRISDRQKALKSFYSAIKNTAEYKSLDDDPANTTNALVTPGLFGNSHIPEVFEHMIEDESYDDYGIGSGARYVIKNVQTLNFSFSENPPEYTTVEVQGTLNNFDPTALPEGLASFPGGGNGLVTAIAVDYDMWRSYGFRQPSVVNVPFLQNPESQCAPYASMLLSRNRKNILQGSITIVGNEYMQPGEVVYLEDRGLLFYVTSVQHSLSFGSSFTTTLSLSFGHSPGEYIPTVLDVIGKMLYNNRDIAGYTIQRQSNSGNESNMGVIIRDMGSSDLVLNTGQTSDDVNTYSAFNSQVISNIIYTAAARIADNGISGTPVVAQVELRIYYDQDNPVNDGLNAFANSIKDALSGMSSGPNISVLAGQATTTPAIDPKYISIVSVNLDDDTDRRSPSQKALDMARNQTSNYNSSNQGASLPDNNNGGDPMTFSGGGSQNNNLRTMLFSYIVDCWMSFQNISTTTSTTNLGN